MGTKDNKTDTNRECRCDTHLENTERKMVETIEVLKNLSPELLWLFHTLSTR